MNKKNILLLVLAFVSELCLAQNHLAQATRLAPETRPFHNVTLEVSLKPFKKNEKNYILRVATEMFTQWLPLLRHADTVSIMLWTSDGSEILDYNGNLNQSLEWARYIGNPNTQHPVGSGPENLSLHERAYLYMRNPPEFTYKDLKFIIKALRDAGKNITQKPVRIGTTFDPGPEFAKSEFKYKKHPEILEGKAMGHKSFVFSYATLNEDKQPYAGFPKGIPQGTPFGTFFGRQTQHFLRDLGLDYVWFSNGLGFGIEPWASTGVIFTGKEFNAEKLSDTKAKIVDFWKLFRKECPDYRIETRGTNLSTGIDLAKDGVDLRAIYNGGFNILPPPNSPWAAIDGDFGLEMIGYMSRMAELPDDRYIFRFYTHDPWWLNSPWLDRYGREPHDIYLPMSVARIDSKGTVKLPTHLNLLTVDDSYGNMPVQVPNEVIPHLLKARDNSPTAPGPVVWVYPFKEYHDWAAKKVRLSEMYYGDWLIRQAINNGFPLNTVVSTESFKSTWNHNKQLFKESVLVSIVPDAGSRYEKNLMEFVRSGGKLLLYGPADHAGREFQDFINLENVAPLEGEFNISGNYRKDSVAEKFPEMIRHQALFSGGGLSGKIKKQEPHTTVLSRMTRGDQSRDVAWVRALPEWGGGRIVYVRGTNSSFFDGGRLLQPDNPTKYFTGPLLLRYALHEFDIDCFFEKHMLAVKNPVLAIARSDNGFIFSGYAPNTSVKHFFRLPQGAPILTGYDTKITNGRAAYTFPLAWNREARVFVDQQDGIVGCKEMHSGEIGIGRRLYVSGLKNATVRVYPNDNIKGADIHFYSNARYPWREGKIGHEKGEKDFGNCYKVENVTGELVVSW